MPEAKQFEPHGFTLFCDDLREETTGLTTYVGVYGDVMYVTGQPPFLIKGLALAVHLLYAQGDDFKALTINVTFPGQTDPNVNFPIDPSNLIPPPGLENIGDPLTHPRSHIVVKLAFSPLPVDTFGRLRVSAQWDGTFIPLGSLAIVPHPQQD